MTIFAILMPSPQPALTQQIEAAFPGNFFPINDTQWLVSSSSTVVEVVSKLGIYDAKTPELAPTGSAIVFATTSYYGRAPTTVWDWIRSKLEQPEAKSLG